MSKISDWTRDSVEIIHARMKWGKQPTIEDPSIGLAKEFPNLNKELKNVYDALIRLQTIVDNTDGQHTQETQTQQSAKECPRSVQDPYKDLSKVQEWLQTVLTSSKMTGEHSKLSEYSSSSSRCSEEKSMERIRKKLSTIQCNLLAFVQSSEEQGKDKPQKDTQNTQKNVSNEVMAAQTKEKPIQERTIKNNESVKHQEIDSSIRDSSSRDVARLQEKLQQLTNERNKILAEKEALHTRLSELLSAQLKDDNPRIADLGDSNRPTVIAEKYNQLYDDEWTDGYQALCQMGKSERENIDILLATIKDCYDFCKRQEEIQGTKIVTALTSFESKEPSNNRAGSTKNPDSLDNTPRFTLNELRRQTSVLSKECLINEYFKQKGQTLEQKLVPYIEKCLELCWYMVLQFPVVYMDVCDTYETGCAFNKDVFRHYSRSGKQLDFVVWPPLYLHKDGPLLAKGVAQPLP